MAEKRYSKEDQAKKTADRIHELHERGVIDCPSGDVRPTHPGGMNEALKHMEQNQGATRDQSQEMRERNAQVAKEQFRQSEERLGR